MNKSFLFILVSLTLLSISFCQNLRPQEQDNQFSVLPESINKNSEQQNLKDSGSDDPITNFLIGLALLVVSFPVLWFNEWGYVKVLSILEPARKQCKEVPSYEISSENENHLILTYGKTSCNETLRDDIFPVEIRDAIKLKRVVEMYQWVEKSKSEDNKTRYYYVKEWRMDYVDTSSFKNSGYNNDNANFVAKTKSFYPNEANLGAFLLSQAQIDKCNNYFDIPLPQAITNQLINRGQPVNPLNIQEQVKNPIQLSQFHPIVVQKSGYLYYEQNQSGQEIGDCRIHFTNIHIHEMTVCAMQTDNLLTPYPVRRLKNKKKGINKQLIHSSYNDSLINLQKSTGCCNFIKKVFAPNPYINWVYEEEKHIDCVFREQMANSKHKNMLGRLTGFLMMAIGMCLFLSPAAIILSYIPFFGSFIAGLAMIIFVIFSIVFSLIFSLLTISLAYLFYRPLLGIFLVAICGGGIYAIVAYAH